MPGFTIAEKILAAKSGRSSVRPGEIVDAFPDLVMSHTATWRSVSVMQKVGATKLYDPDRLAVVLDHIAPAKTDVNRANAGIANRLQVTCRLWRDTIQQRRRDFGWSR